MPTVLRAGPYRFFFFSSDGAEPPHVHVERDSNRAKIWLDPVILQDGGGFAPQELNRLRAIVLEHRDYLLAAWNEHFST